MPSISTLWEGKPNGCFFRNSRPFKSVTKGWFSAENQGGFVNVPLSDLEGAYLVVCPQAVIGVRVEPQFSSVDDA